ncbi:hypothetical protein CBLAS_0066 [Campylobacter blaseri]|uniref:Uncharacterized protein n=1 Tax=Campylobacter blaseri TaxID=2042961 RepID=A0A2P8R3D2_9BACT|nr:hypothetical protein [Campylobacter blaseri]PSM53006.1 hypothetical protein CQ405_00155 [Campylobacter blaseri]PSM54473.1 hypothetical protein CRN67_00155 [Campylobacter blaseri]QKF85283.1 hypothetical protein CBLAS_0066 [Campylobacter blaseri]
MQKLFFGLGLAFVLGISLNAQNNARKMGECMVVSDEKEMTPCEVVDQRRSSKAHMHKDEEKHKNALTRNSKINDFFNNNHQDMKKETNETVKIDMH